MPDSSSVPAASGGVLPRLAGLALAAIGGAVLIVAAFLPWFTATPDLSGLGSLLSGRSLEAEISGVGAVTMPEFDGYDVSSAIATDAAWAGWTVIVLAVAAVAAAAAGAFLRSPLGRTAGAVTGLCGLAALGVAAYALIIPTGHQAVPVAGLSVDVDTTAAAGPYIVIGGAVALLLGSLALLLARRSAVTPGPAPAAAPAAPFAPAPANPGQPVPGQPVPPVQANAAPPGPVPPHGPGADAGWARPASSVQGPAAPSNPEPPQADEHQVTAIAPVAQRRPQPEWDRNWPTAIPPQPQGATPPAPTVPSEQHTVVVKRPPRPVRVSPKPETEAIPRRDPRFDGPTGPL